MKKIISLLLASAIVLSSAFCVSAGELGECTATLIVNPIEHNINPRNPLNITVTVPEDYDNGTVFAAFYGSGKLTKLEALDATSGNTKQITYAVTFDEDDGLALTPDEIKLFTWQNGSIKPLAKTGNILEDSTIVEAANENTIKDILNYILEYEAPSGTKRSGAVDDLEEYIYDHITEEEAENSVALTLIKEIRACAEIVNSNKSTMLLTSESTKRLLGTHFDTLVSLCKEIKDNTELASQKDLLHDAYFTGFKSSAANKKKAIDYLARFFDLELPV